MKLLYYVGTGSNKFGGLEKFNICLFKLLKAEGWEIVVVYRRPIVNGPFKSFLDENKIPYRWLYDTFAITGESKLTNALRLAKIVSEYKPDLIHYNFGNLYDIALTRFRSPFQHFKAVYTAHCHANLKSRYLRIVFGFITPFVRKIFCVSKAINEEFVKHLNSKKSQVLYLGVPENKNDRQVCRRKYGFADDEIIITNIAYHDPIKGVDILIKAADYLKNTLGVNNFRVIQIGGSPIKDAAENLKKLLVEVSLGKNFEMWGLRDDVESIMAATDVYCQPSRSEGIPLSLMEAGMASVPVVATRVGGIPEVAFNGENAFLCESEKYEEIGQRLNELISDSLKRERMGRKGRQITSEKFNIEKQAASLVEIYKEIK
jgi:hypothetical protein